MSEKRREKREERKEVWYQYKRRLRLKSEPLHFSHFSEEFCFFDSSTPFVRISDVYTYSTSTIWSSSSCHFSIFVVAWFLGRSCTTFSSKFYKKKKFNQKKIIPPIIFYFFFVLINLFFVPLQKGKRLLSYDPTFQILRSVNVRQLSTNFSFISGGSVLIFQFMDSVFIVILRSLTLCIHKRRGLWITKIKQLLTKFCMLRVDTFDFCGKAIPYRASSLLFQIQPVCPLLQNTFCSVCSSFCEYLTHCDRTGSNIHGKIRVSNSQNKETHVHINFCS